MQLEWTRQALRQLANAQGYIALDNPVAAHQIGQLIADATRLLLVQPQIGRPGRLPGTREWVVKHTPYFLVYVVNEDRVQILRVLHGRQLWPPPQELSQE